MSSYKYVSNRTFAIEEITRRINFLKEQERIIVSKKIIAGICRNNSFKHGFRHILQVIGKYYEKAFSAKGMGIREDRLMSYLLSRGPLDTHLSRKVLTSILKNIKPKNNLKFGSRFYAGTGGNVKNLNTRNNFFINVIQNNKRST